MSGSEGLFKVEATGEVERAPLERKVALILHHLLATFHSGGAPAKAELEAWMHDLAQALEYEKH